MTKLESPIGVFSKAFTEPQSKKSAFERELLDGALACRHFLEYLIDKNFILFSDNQALTSALKIRQTIHCMHPASPDKLII